MVDRWEYAVNSKAAGRWTDPAEGRPGKWLIFVSQRDVDRRWSLIRTATEAGTLGTAAKVSLDFGEHVVICVYTADYRDHEDVARVLRRLRELGFTQSLSYKEDGATHAGVYGHGAALYVAAEDAVTVEQRRAPFDEETRPSRDGDADSVGFGERVCSACFLVVPTRLVDSTGRCRDCA